MCFDEPVQMFFRKGPELQLFSQIDIVVLELLIEQRDLELLFAVFLKSDESPDEQQEKHDETEEQLRAN